MLQPARRKFRKEQKGRNTGIATRGALVSFGDFGLKATERGRLTARQIEAARVAITRFVKRGGKLWIRVFPDKPITKKAAETQFTGAAANYGASAVQQAIRRPTQIIPPLLPTSGPAMYGAMRAQSGAMPIIGPGSQRRYY